MDLSCHIRMFNRAEEVKVYAQFILLILRGFRASLVSRPLRMRTNDQLFATDGKSHIPGVPALYPGLHC